MINPQFYYVEQLNREAVRAHYDQCASLLRMLNLETVKAHCDHQASLACTLN